MKNNDKRFRELNDDYDIEYDELEPVEENVPKDLARKRMLYELVINFFHVVIGMLMVFLPIFDYKFEVGITNKYSMIDMSLYMFKDGEYGNISNSILLYLTAIITAILLIVTIQFLLYFLSTLFKYNGMENEFNMSSDSNKVNKSVKKNRKNVIVFYNVFYLVILIIIVILSFISPLKENKVIVYTNFSYSIVLLFILVLTNLGIGTKYLKACYPKKKEETLY